MFEESPRRFAECTNRTSDVKRGDVNVAFERTDVLRTRYDELTTKLDARTVAGHMYQRNALTLKDLQSIQSESERPVVAAEMLLNIIIEQPDAVYMCFLDVLKRSEQQHIYQLLVEGGYRGQCGDFELTLIASRVITQETQLSRTNRATHLWKCNGVADP